MSLSDDFYSFIVYLMTLLSITDYMSLNDLMIVDDALDRIWKDADVK
jgi:hypothetical protein